MCLQYAMNLLTHLILQHCLSCYSGAYRHDLYRYNPHLSIRRILAIVSIKVCQKWYIHVKSDTDAVYKHNREPCFGSVRPVPVS